MTTRDLKLDPLSGDLVVEEGDLALISDGEAISQNLRQRLAFVMGEWFLDESDGTPWFQRILGRKGALQEAEAILRQRVAETPGVKALTSFEVTWDASARRVTVEWTASTDLGELTGTTTQGPA